MRGAGGTPGGTPAARGSPGRRVRICLVDVLERFDEQLRRSVVDEDGLFVSDGWSAVLAVPRDIDRALSRLRELPGHAEWKLYGHDPPGIEDRLRAAGMVPDEEEAVLVAEASSIPPPEVEVTVARTAELVGVFAELADRVFGHPMPTVRDELLRALAQDEPTMLATIVLADGVAVSGGRVDLPKQGEFAGLFGGVTVPKFRRRGLYRATVAERARVARDRGYRWLYVDALPTSRPILERLGFQQITTTTPWTWQPHAT
jgi:GNAT superfamily N-acetyltransferase